jgi:hypothetical protein
LVRQLSTALAAHTAAKVTVVHSRSVWDRALNTAHDSRISEDSEEILVASPEERTDMLRASDERFQELLAIANDKS